MIRRPTRPTVSLLAVALVIAAAAALTFSFDLGVALEILRAHHGRVLSFVVEAPALASILFMVLYAVAVAISLPGVAILTIVAGYLFGWLHGTALVLIGATAGASGVFLLARSALGTDVRARAAPAVQRFAEGFRRNALSYGFALNVVPIFPYALIIAVPAACGVPLPTFLAGMFLGLVPGTFLFAGLGDGLEEVLARGVPLRLTDFITPGVVLSLSALGGLALLPVVWRALRR
ncbi:MAG TPA: VTT domain-containing protein [Geminicoccaceae bacterium]|nr:VTT domain-containing protein [Geminicoccaceae bacterium]